MSTFQNETAEYWHTQFEYFRDHGRELQTANNSLTKDVARLTAKVKEQEIIISVLTNKIANVK